MDKERIREKKSERQKLKKCQGILSPISGCPQFRAPNLGGHLEERPQILLLKNSILFYY